MIKSSTALHLKNRWGQLLALWRKSIRQSPVGNQKGLSILEVLIASTILAILGISIVNITNNSLETKDKVLSEDKEVLDVETAMSVIQWDFAQIYSPLFFDSRAKTQRDPQGDPIPFQGTERFPLLSEDGLPIPAFTSQDKTSFEFFSTSHRRRVADSKQSHFTWVRYSLRPTEKTASVDEDGEEDPRHGKPSFDLIRSSSPDNPYAAEAPDPDQVKDYVLLKYITNWQFLFWDPKTEKFVESLNDVQNGRHLLKAMKVKFAWLDFLGREIKEERIFYSSWPDFEEKKTSGDPPPPPPLEEQ